jgi:(2R)-3-sulfolactate dehydrogenase (NADP+)
MSETNLSIESVINLVTGILESHKTSTENAGLVAKALVAAEIEGQKGHGLSRVASYAAQSKSGKVDGYAKPRVSKVADAAIRVDAQHGFAFPAFVLAAKELGEMAAKTGIAIAAIHNSHHCGVLGHHAEKLAQSGLMALVFSNSPKAMAPWGGKEAVYGTNPIAFAAPRKNQEPLVIDLSLSKVARGKVKVAFEKGQAIPVGWALDAQGNPTTDAGAAMDGTMLPMGDAKGATLVMMVEILAAALTASHFGFEASSFFAAEGPSPDIGQLIIAIAPGPLSSDAYYERMETLMSAILDQGGTRLPGSKRKELWETAEKNGIGIEEKMVESLMKMKKEE